MCFCYIIGIIGGEFMNNGKIFVGNIMRCVRYRKKTASLFGNFDTADKGNCIDIQSEIYKEYAILLQVSDGCYIDFNNLKTSESLRKIIECVSLNISLDGVILKTFETSEGCLYVDHESLRCFDEIESIPDKILDKRLVRVGKK